MRTDTARELRATDKVIWTWTVAPDRPPSPGQVIANNEHAVSILWDDADGVNSVFFFDDDIAWSHIDLAPEEPHYEAVARQIRRPIRRRKARQ